MTTKTTPFDPSRHLESSEDVVTYLDMALEYDDPQLLTQVLGDIARSNGMTALANETGLSRESLYRSLSARGNPNLQSLTKVLSALGLRLSVKRRSPEEPVTT